MLLPAAAALAQVCTNRGQLDDLYCDTDREMAVDAPLDKTGWKNPSTLIFTYTPIEDPAVYQKIFADFQEYLAQCTGRRVVYYQVQSNAAQIEAMRAGRLHLGGFSTGSAVTTVSTPPISSAIWPSCERSQRIPAPYSIARRLIARTRLRQKIALAGTQPVAWRNPGRLEAGDNPRSSVVDGAMRTMLVDFVTL